MKAIMNKMSYRRGRRIEYQVRDHFEMDFWLVTMVTKNRPWI